MPAEETDYQLEEFRVVCSTGTYVRTLADDMARALGGFAHLTSLRRTSNGSLHVSSAVDVEVLAAANGGWREHLLPMRDGLVDLPEVRIGAEAAKAISNGLSMPAAALGLSAPSDANIRVIGPDGKLLAVYGIADQKAAPEVVLS